MPSRKKKTHNFLVVWDVLGLESIFDVDDAMRIIEDYEKESAWKLLKDEPVSKRPNPIPLQMLLMRARVNTQRSYEIYTFNSQFTMNEVRKLFADNPQPIVDWIRENGNKIYSDYSKTKKNLIV